MRFKGELFEHQQVGSQIKSVLENFCNWLTEIGYKEDLECCVNPFAVDYHQDFTSYSFNGEIITVNFSYQDPYEYILDSETQVRFPVSWVEAYLQGCVAGRQDLEKEIIQEILEYNNQLNKQDLGNLKRQAERAGYRLVKLED